MKKLLLSFTILMSGLTFAQDIEIYHEGSTTDISGTTVFGSGDADEMKYYMGIKNNTNQDLALTIKRLRIEETAGTENYFCWGVTLNTGACYSHQDANPWTSIDEFTFSAGTVGILYSYHVPNGNYGIAKYRYYVMSDDVALDSIDVQYNNVLSVKQSKPTNIVVYPNPANDILNVSIENLPTEGSITIYDIAGKVVSTTAIRNGKNQVNVTALNAGVYFYTIRSNKDIIETKKLMIQ
ncbi:MAG: T9SS type A sorting domain-containing protein [Putridiphycobacter sp.]|nr:T9SS type A sorting domain-containing protein [Putridiphycobacter sp.]